MVPWDIQRLASIKRKFKYFAYPCGQYELQSMIWPPRLSKMRRNVVFHNAGRTFGNAENPFSLEENFRVNTMGMLYR